jgi:L-histidine Nalpha-methyltransferase
MLHTHTVPSRNRKYERTAEPSLTQESQQGAFRRHVIEGLLAAEKRISSAYLYDATGDRIFQSIMASPDYYVSRCEAEIFRTHSSAITRALAEDVEQFELLELGAGDASKTTRLLRKWCSKGARPVYRPADISSNILDELRRKLSQEMQGLQVDPVQGEYFDILERLPEPGAMHRVLLFLGSSIGNLEREEAVRLMRRMACRMGSTDRLMIGFDLKKDPRIIRRAYDDRAGLTREFNINLLHRINRELGADLHIDLFRHEPVYDPFEGKALSYLVSTQEQQVNIPGAPGPILLQPWEAIHTETSQKYDLQMIDAMADSAGLQVISTFLDRRSYFADVVMAPRV